MGQEQISAPVSVPFLLKPVVSALNEEEYPFENLPTPPGGRALYEFDLSLSWPRKLWVLSSLFGLLLIIAAASRITMLRMLSLPGAFQPVSSSLSSPDLLVFASSVVLVWVGGHETIHALICRWYGWEFTITFTRWGTPGIVPRHTFQTRRETATMLLAPAILITIVCVGVVGTAALTPWSLSSYVTAGVLLLCTFNLGSSIIDCYTVWKLGALPSGSLLYTTDYRTVVAISDLHESR